jgi:hypothetical protein
MLISSAINNEQLHNCGRNNLPQENHQTQVKFVFCFL